MKIVLSIAFLLVLFVGMTVPSFAQVSDSLQVSIDKTEYLPGSYVKISASSSNVIPFEGLKFSVSDPNGKVIEKGILYPTNGQFYTSVFVSTVNPVFGDYKIDFEYSINKETVNFTVIDDVKDSTLFTLSTEKPVYGLGESVVVNGRLNNNWIQYINFEISQINNSNHDDLSSTATNFLKTTERIKLDGLGKFVYEFQIPNSNTRLGDYSITVSEDIGSKKIFFSVVSVPENNSISSEPLTLKVNKEKFLLNVDKTIIITGRAQTTLERSDYETSLISLTLLGNDNQPILMDRAIKDKNGSIINSEKIPFELTVTPDETGYFSLSTDLIRQIFSTGTYTLQANYLGNYAEHTFEIIDELDNAEPGIYLDNQIYGLGVDLYLNGFVPINEKYVTIEIMKPDGSTLKFGTVVENEKISWSWQTPSFESGLGVYRIIVSSASFYDDAVFKVSLEPENDSLPQKSIWVTTDKPIYKAGEKIFLNGNVSVERKSTVSFSIPERVLITLYDKNNSFKEILQSSVYTNDLGEFSGNFVLTPTIFPTGEYLAKVNYGSSQYSQIFSVSNDFVFGIDDPVKFLVQTDKNTYNPGDSVQITGSPNKLIYVDKYDISIIQKSETEINCGSFICGIHNGPVTTILPGPNGSFEYDFDIPNSIDSIGEYEVVVDADFETKHLVFSVVDKIPINSPEILFEKQNRITENSVGVKLESKITETSTLLPRVLSGSLISVPGDESKVNLKVSNELGQCIIGQDDDCLVSESTRKPGQIFDTVSVNGENFKVRYSGTDARLEKFNILPENDESFLPLENWTVEVIKENQASKLYYKVTYKIQQ